MHPSIAVSENNEINVRDCGATDDIVSREANTTNKAVHARHDGIALKTLDTIRSHDHSAHRGGSHDHSAHRGGSPDHSAHRGGSLDVCSS